jgi:DNA-binding PadR family transcriptional regulator
MDTNSYTCPDSDMTQHTRLKAHWFHILLSLADRDLHGTAIMEEVLERTESQIRLWPGKLYGALKGMVDTGLITEVDAPSDAPTEGGKRRFYSVTRNGRLVLHEEVERLAALVQVARAKGATGHVA